MRAFLELNDLAPFVKRVKADAAAIVLALLKLLYLLLVNYNLSCGLELLELVLFERLNGLSVVQISDIPNKIENISDYRDPRVELRPVPLPQQEVDRGRETRNGEYGKEEHEREGEHQPYNYVDNYRPFCLEVYALWGRA